MNFKILSLSLYFSILFNISGVLGFFFTGLDVSKYNFFIAFLFLFPLFFYFSSYFLHFSVSNRKTKHAGFFIIFLICVIISVSFSIIHGEQLKLLRDVLYMFFFFFFVCFFSVLENKNEESFHMFISYFLSFNLMFFVFVGILLGRFDVQGRFIGMMDSSAILGVSLSFFILIVFEIKNYFSRKHFLLLIVISTFSLFMTGSRAPLLIVLLYFIFLIAYNLKFIFYFLLVIIVVSLSFIDFSWLLGQDSSLRILSTADIEGGSLGTRLSWYLTLLFGLYKNYFFGGYGAGASEVLIGYIPHFDLLRFWYDYSLIFILFFLIFLILPVFITRSSHKKEKIFFIFTLFLLVSLHNAFQSPNLIFLFSMTVFLISRGKKV